MVGNHRNVRAMSPGQIRQLEPSSSFTMDRALPPAVGVAMRQFDSIPHSEDIVHPTCAKCGAPMWLTRIEPDKPSLEKRTFECQACQNEAIEVVKFR